MRVFVCLLSFVLGFGLQAQPIMRDTTGSPLCEDLLARLRTCPAERIAALRTDPQAPRAWQVPESPAEQHLRQIMSGQALEPSEMQRYRAFHLLPRDPHLEYEQNCAELSDWLPAGC